MFFENYHWITSIIDINSQRFIKIGDNNNQDPDSITNNIYNPSSGINNINDVTSILIPIPVSFLHL